MKKEFRPTPEMRTNQLSKKPGGSTVKLVYEDYEVSYDKIKYPEAYIDKIKKTGKSPESIYLDGELYWKLKK